MDERGSQFTPGDDEKYGEDRRARLHRSRVVGFLACIALWVLGIIPLARESTHGREGAEVVLVYVAVAAISLGVAVVIRGIYVQLMKRRFWSPWVFVIAAVLAIAGYAVQSAGEEEIPIAGAPARESITE
jgi:hypothetical protein